MPSSRPLLLLIATATILVAVVFAFAGVQKLRVPDPSATLLGRYVDSPQGVRAIGCMELGMALWLLSFRTPRIAGGVAAVTLAVFSVVIFAELHRNAPLPCGCLEMRPGIDSPQAVRRDLWISLGRNAFLITCAVTSALLAPPRDEDEIYTAA